MKFFIAAFLLPTLAIAQDYAGLSQMKGHKASVYFSEGAIERTMQLAEQCDRVMAFYKEKIGTEPMVNLLVLSPADWTKFAAKGAVYGMPHYTSKKELVVASEDNVFWKGFAPPVDKLPPNLAKSITDTYTSKSGSLSMQPFFDLLAIHELGHAFHNQGGLKMQRKWMGELFANIMLHTYIAEKEPALLPALTVFPQLMIAQGKAGLKYTTLADFETNYNDLGQNQPRNYGWYQCRLHSAAADIYNGGGLKAFTKLWNALKTQEVIANDQDFAALLTSVDPAVASVVLKWDDK